MYNTKFDIYAQRLVARACCRLDTYTAFISYALHHVPACVSAENSPMKAGAELHMGCMPVPDQAADVSFGAAAASWTYPILFNNPGLPMLLRFLVLCCPLLHRPQNRPLAILM